MPRVSPNCVFSLKRAQKDPKNTVGLFPNTKGTLNRENCRHFYDDGYFSSRAKNASPSIRTAFPGFSPVTISSERKVNQLPRVDFLLNL